MMKIKAALSACMLFSPLAQAVDAEKGIFEDKEDMGIYLNKYVGNLMETIDDSDKLSLLYVFHSKILNDAEGQDWTHLDKMFMKVLDELKRGYVTTYAIDCAVEHAEVDPKMNLKGLCEREPWQPVFQLFKPAEMRFNPYTGKKMPVE